METLTMKILLALDGSESSITARDLVANLKWPRGTVVHLLSAYRVPVDWTAGFGSTMSWVGDVEDALRDQLADQLREAAAPLVERGLEVEQHVLSGRAPDVIVDAARDLEVDLVVTGSRGRGALKSMLLGSVANEVASRAPSPVLVARGDSVSRMLVATDGSPSAERIPQLLNGWGAFDGVPVDVVAVAVPDSPTYEMLVTLYTLGDERLERQRRELQQAAGDDADEMARRLTELGMPATAHVRSGDAATEIVNAAADHEADLVVTGSRGLSGLERFVLGSVARNVLTQAGRSVLIARGDPDAHSDEDRNSDRDREEA
jgi:nucleotide-binding universal stress UspA family protein